MAIIVERFEDSEDLIKTYSDAGFKIQQVQTGIVYDEAIDLISSGYTYIETNEPINSNFEEEEENFEEPELEEPEFNSENE